MIGIMTFHAAYNFGSSFQAYATQKVINDLGYECEIINYRLPNQLHYYGDILTMRFGRSDTLRRVLCLQELSDRKKRAERYEHFINSKLRLTQKVYHSFEDLRNENFDYSVLIAGSDQVWNEHCTAEFRTEPADSILGYFLDFENNKDVKRISFSSSLGSMKQGEIQKYKDLLSRFAYLSLRESDGASMINKLVGRTVANTVDPTLLLHKDEWLNEFKDELETNSDRYILLYTLQKSPRKLLNTQKKVLEFANGSKVICLSPFLPSHIDKIVMRNDAGPLEFLSLLANAKCVVTDSFHGTAFSINFGIPFYTLRAGKDERKQLLLGRVGLENQLIDSVDDLRGKGIPEIDFDNASKFLNVARQGSLDYLKNSLN